MKLKERKPGQFLPYDPKKAGSGAQEADPNVNAEEKVHHDFKVIRERPGKFWAPSF